MIRRLDGPPDPALVAVLRTTGLLAQLEVSAQDAVIEDLEWQALAADDVLSTAGERTCGMHVLVAGRVDVFDARGRRLRRIEIGEPVGETGLLADEVATTTVRAMRDSVLVHLSRARFEGLALRHPAVLLALTRVLVERLRGADASRTHHERCRVIAVAPASLGAHAEAFARRLAELWLPPEAATWIGSREVTAELGGPLAGEPGDAEHVRLTRWLHALERQHGTLVLVTDASETEWTRYALREADTILLVAEAGREPEPASESLRRPARVGAADRRELVLLHPRGTAPRETQRWLSAFPVAAHHHVRAGHDDDVRRVARFLCGQALTLVLSGGAARAIAHVGVMRALEEAGVVVDQICGTSMGAVVAGLHARGRDAEQIRQVMRRYLRERSIFDFTLPTVSAVAGRRLAEFMTACFGEVHIEDLWLPFFCVSSNLRAARTVVHRAGPVGEAVRCSSAVPGLFPPVHRDGEVIIDGLFLDNLPVETARERGGRVIAVNVIPLGDPGFGAFPRGSGLGQLVRSLNPFAAGWQPPPIVGLVMQAFFLGTLRAAEAGRAQADLYVEPAVGGIHFLDSGRFDEAVEIGYHAMKSRLAGWR